MPGPILNATCEIIPLPFQVPPHSFTATPETLPIEIQRYRMVGDEWSLYTGLGKRDLLPIFERERLVQYGPNNHRPWVAGHADASALERIKFEIKGAGRSHQGLPPWRGDAIELGPGWECYAADIYWAVARALNGFLGNCEIPDNERMVAMALDAMMRSHGRA